MNHQDFYLASNDNVQLTAPIRCQVVGLMRDKCREDFLLIHVDPHIEIDGKYLQVDRIRSFEHVLLAPRHQVSNWPDCKDKVEVYVLGLKSEELPSTEHTLDASEYWNLAWATTYLSIEDAMKGINKFTRSTQ